MHSFKMLVCLALKSDAVTFLTRDAGTGSLDEIAYLDGKDDVEIITKRLHSRCDDDFRGDTVVVHTTACVIKKYSANQKIGARA
jgi:hypothetical protein